jgi:twitching motility protein PilT
VVSQRLVPKVGGGRFALLEIMGSNLRTKETIVQGESEGKTFYEIIESSQSFGWRTFDLSAVEAYEQGIITEESAMLYCSKRGPVTRAIDNLKKSRGESTSQVSSLRMKLTPAAGNGKNGAPPLPATLKLK